MKRAALLCLLALTSCQDRDPKGTVYPDEKGHLNVEVRQGDSPPFRLDDGDTEFSLLMAEDVDMDLLRDCEGELALVQYKGDEVRRFDMTNPYGFLARVNGLDAGVYFLRFEPNQISCAYTAFIGPA